MKNLKRKWFPLMLAFIFVFTLSNCVEKNKSQKEEASEEVKKEEASEEVKEPEGIISLEDAKILCDNYESRRLQSILDFEKAQNGSEEKFVPTQFVNFDFKTIRKYIKYVERQARKAKVEPDSLRIYFGNYGPKGEDPNKNTVFILPTTELNGEHGGYFINSDGKAKLIRNHWPENSTGMQKSKAGILPSLNMNMYNGKSFILNHGQGGPPPTGDF